MEGLSSLVRLGKFGTYLESKQLGENGDYNSYNHEITPADLDEDIAEMILKQKAEDLNPLELIRILDRIYIY